MHTLRGLGRHSPRPRSPATAPSSTRSTQAPSTSRSPNVVLQLHRDLYEFAPQPRGPWKTSDNLVTEERTDGTVAVRFTPVPALDTPGAMDELHRHLDDAWRGDRHHRLLLTGAYVLDFLVIHPFTDGNGRMSRLLTLLLLYKAGYEVGRFIQHREADRAEQGDLPRGARGVDGTMARRSA